MKRPEKTPLLVSGGSIATPSLVAGIMNAKYVNGMPLARQEREFARYNLNLSTKTMANWIIGCADRYLSPLYDRMKEAFLKSRYIHCDETRIQVIGEPDQKVPKASVGQSLASGEKYIIWLFHDASKQELLFYEWGFLVELGNAFCVHSFALPKVPLLL